MVRVKQLRNQIGTIGPREVIYCPTCFIEYTANAGDYWSASPEYVFRHCKRSMRLGFKVTTYRDLRVSANA